MKKLYSTLYDFTKHDFENSFSELYNTILSRIRHQFYNRKRKSLKIMNKTKFKNWKVGKWQNGTARWCSATVRVRLQVRAERICSKLQRQNDQPELNQSNAVTCVISGTALRHLLVFLSNSGITSPLFHCFPLPLCLSLSYYLFLWRILIFFLFLSLLF